MLGERRDGAKLAGFELVFTGFREMEEHPRCAGSRDDRHVLQAGTPPGDKAKAAGTSTAKEVKEKEQTPAEAVQDL